MSRPYSMDLRERLVRAVESEGFSPRKAAARFGIAPSTAVDFTLRGLVHELAERGLKVDYRSVWEFVHAEGLSHTKKRWSPPSRIAPMSLAAADSGSLANL